MSVNGSWRLAIDSPMGKQDFSVELQRDGDALTGTLVNNSSQRRLDGAVVDLGIR
jgi:hypothetical protein